MDDAAVEKSSTNDPEPKSLNLLTKVGLVVTCGWLLFVLVYFITMWSAFLRMDPNEFGDFLAGTFAPLAFLWLVLGFFQQGVELRNSSRALWLQGEELRNSVEQQRALVDTTREQLEFERELLKQQQAEVRRTSAPILKVSLRSRSTSEGAITHSFRVSNFGSSCTDVRLTFDGRSGGATWDALPRGKTEGFQFTTPIGEEFSVIANFDYMDERLLSGTQRFRITRDDKNPTLIEAMPEVEGR